MTEIETLQRFRANVPPADHAVLSRARERLMAEAWTGGVPVTSTPAVRPWHATIRWRVAAVAAAALLVAGALIGVAVPRSASVDPATARLPAIVPDTDAARVLQQAALTAMRLPPSSVRPDQFVFLEQIRQDSMDRYDANTGTNTWSKNPQELVRLWLSADGRSNGLNRSYDTGTMEPGDDAVIGGCRDGVANPVPSGGVTIVDPRLPGGGCTPTPAYRSELPTSTDAMVAYLYRSRPEQSPPDQQAFDAVVTIVGGSYVPPPAKSALFSAAARIPGVTVTHDIVDAVGRHGIAVGRTYHGIQDQLIFDSATYAFLGERSVAVESVDGLTPGWVVSFTAMLRVAIADRPGQLP